MLAGPCTPWSRILHWLGSPNICWKSTFNGYWFLHFTFLDNSCFHTQGQFCLLQVLTYLPSQQLNKTIQTLFPSLWFRVGIYDWWQTLQMPLSIPCSPMLVTFICYQNPSKPHKRISLNETHLPGGPASSRRTILSLPIPKLNDSDGSSVSSCYCIYRSVLRKKVDDHGWKQSSRS